MSESVLAWHFLRPSRIPGAGSRKRPLYVGHLWRVKGPPVLCKHGLHASERILDALRYAPGPVACHVEVGGTIVRAFRKLAGTRRRILAMGDITYLLHTWACDVAKQTGQQAGMMDSRSLAALDYKRRWLQKDATNDESATATTWQSAWAAAYGIARESAWATAWATVKGAADSDAWESAWESAWADLNADLEQKALKTIGALEVAP